MLSMGRPVRRSSDEVRNAGAYGGGGRQPGAGLEGLGDRRLSTMSDLSHIPPENMHAGACGGRSVSANGIGSRRQSEGVSMHRWKSGIT
jgi:hypothetical protein